METNIPISLTNQNEDIREYEKNYEEAIAQVKADTEKRLQEMKEEHDKCLKELIEKRDSTVVQQKKEAEIIDIKNADRILRSVFTSMLNKAEEAQDPAKPVKFIAEQFMRFANDIYLPIVLPGYKIDCEFLKTQRTTIDGKKLPDDKNAGIKVILLDQEAYDDRIEKISKLSGCCGKCLASKHDLTKIGEAAFDPNNALIRADYEFSNAVEALEALGVVVRKKPVKLSAGKLSLDTIRKKYNDAVVSIRQLHPTCPLLTIPEDATIGQVVDAAMRGALLIRDLIKSIKARKASKKSGKNKLPATGDRFPLPLQLGAKSKFKFPSAKSIVSKLVIYINQFYAEDIPHVDPNACLVDVINALNKVIDFVNGKFNTKTALRGVVVKKDTKMSVIHDILLTIIKILYYAYTKTAK